MTMPLRRLPTLLMYLTGPGIFIRVLQAIYGDAVRVDPAGPGTVEVALPQQSRDDHTQGWAGDWCTALGPPVCWTVTATVTVAVREAASASNSQTTTSSLRPMGSN